MHVTPYLIKSLNLEKWGLTLFVVTQSFSRNMFFFFPSKIKNKKRKQTAFICSISHFRLYNTLFLLKENLTPFILFIYFKNKRKTEKRSKNNKIN